MMINPIVEKKRKRKTNNIHLQKNTHNTKKEKKNQKWNNKRKHNPHKQYNFSI